MTHLGMGVMIHALFDNPSKLYETYAAALGKTIQSLVLDPDANSGNGEVRIVFTDGTDLILYDAGQSCCEARYLHTNDDLACHVGATLLKIETSEGPTIDDEYDVHELVFLNITTSVGVFTIETHNEHNGYYGGFALRVRTSVQTDDDF